jgi:hypothetical protein
VRVVQRPAGGHDVDQIEIGNHKRYR